MAARNGAEIAGNAAAIAYWECRRNHAAHIGRYGLDGCGEFLKDGEDGTPEALICGACGCHRSFHRKGLPPGSHRLAALRLRQLASAAMGCDPYDLTPQELLLHQQQQQAQLLHACQFIHCHPAPGEGREMEETSRNRRRTILTREQKARLTTFAEQLQWRLQRQDEEKISRFCSEIGISIQVFRVWVGNNRRRRVVAAKAA